MSPRRHFPLALPLALLMALALAACGGDGDSPVDAGANTDDTATEDPAAEDPASEDPGTEDPASEGDAGDQAAGGGATRPWIGGEWSLASATVGGEPLTLPADPVTMTITGPDQVNGSGGCNSFGGTISAPFGDGDFGDLSFGNLAITEMACDPASIMDFETSYVGALTGADSWELAPPTGLVFRGDGIELIYEIELG